MLWLQILLVIILFLLLLIIALITIWLRYVDSDLTLWFFEQFGKRSENLKEKVIWITGASSGIGESLALRLAKCGCKLIISGRQSAKLDEIKLKCISLGLEESSILCLPFDTLDINGHGQQLFKALERFKKIDILVLNAGRSQRALFNETELEVDIELFRLNVFATINLSRLVLNHWYNSAQAGQIAVTSSLTGKFGVPNAASYCASKHALHGYFEALRYECYDKGVRISMLCPGPVFSNLAERAFTGRTGETFGIVHGTDMKRMKTDRCAQLIAVAIANELNESWICMQPILALLYANQYLPGLSKLILPRYLSIDRVSKYREGGDISNV